MNDKDIFLLHYNTHIFREGAECMLQYLEESDFFYAPCSTRFHLACEGGLVKHSINVYDNFCKLCEMFNSSLSDESIAICSLLHDVCKIHCYNSERRSRKTGRLLPNGKPEWEDYMGYAFDEEFPYGHGEKSVFMIQNFMRLSPKEAMTIRWHMGFSDASFKCGMPTVSNAMDKYPEIALLHSADLLATAYE